MDLQHQQLQQLTNWLDATEARIKRMGSQPLGPDLEDVKHQVEEHKVPPHFDGLQFLCGSCSSDAAGVGSYNVQRPFWLRNTQ